MENINPKEMSLLLSNSAEKLGHEMITDPNWILNITKGRALLLNKNTQKWEYKETGCLICTRRKKITSDKGIDFYSCDNQVCYNDTFIEIDWTKFTRCLFCQKIVKEWEFVNFGAVQITLCKADNSDCQKRVRDLLTGGE